MTTLEPGASVVFTQGWRCRPRSTAFLASRAAPIITDGLDVLVQEVIAAMTTAPWSISVSVPSSSVTLVGVGRPPALPPGRDRGRHHRAVAVDGDRVAGRERLGDALVHVGLRCRRTST